MKKSLYLLILVVISLLIGMVINKSACTKKTPDSVTIDTLWKEKVVKVEIPADSSKWVDKIQHQQSRIRELEDFSQEQIKQINQLHNALLNTDTGKVKTVLSENKFELTSGTVIVETESFLPLLRQRVKFDPKPVSFVSKYPTIHELRILTKNPPFYKRWGFGFAEGVIFTAGIVYISTKL